MKTKELAGSISGKLVSERGSLAISFDHKRRQIAQRFTILCLR